MVKGRVSIIIPSRNERLLKLTVEDLLAKAAGDIEILAVLDGGPWPDPPLPEDKRLIVIRNNESIGMRPVINAAAQVASGEFLMKCDAHMFFGEHFDEILKADCGDDWLMVPTRHSLDEPTWERDGWKAALRLRHFNYHAITFPFLPSMYGMGVHGVTFAQNENKAINAQREAFVIDDIISSQGSCWFQRRDYFLSFPPLDHSRLYFYGESIEYHMRILASGGRTVIHKGTFAAHYHKGRDNRGADGRVGRGFFLDLHKKRRCEAILTDWCTRGWPSEWPNAHRTFIDIVEQHWWLISQMRDPRYAWPEDWRDFEKHRIWFENRPAEAIPAHL